MLFNRYSYVLGNPLKYWDPTGNDTEGFDCAGTSDRCEEVGDSGENDGCDPNKDCVIVVGSEIDPIVPGHPDYDPYSDSLDDDGIANNLFGNTFLQAYGDETGYVEAWRNARFEQNAGQLEGLLNDPSTSTETLQNALGFLNQHGNQSTAYNGLAQRFQNEIDRRNAPAAGGSSGVLSDTRGSNSQAGENIFGVDVLNNGLPTVTGSLDASGQVFGGFLGASFSTGPTFDTTNVNTCLVSTVCFQFGLGVFGGVGVGGGAGISAEALRSGSADSFGVFGNVGAFGAAFGGSLNVGGGICWWSKRLLWYR